MPAASFRKKMAVSLKKITAGHLNVMDLWRPTRQRESLEKLRGITAEKCSGRWLSGSGPGRWVRS